MFEVREIFVLSCWNFRYGSGVQESEECNWCGFDGSDDVGASDEVNGSWYGLIIAVIISTGINCSGKSY